MYYGLASAFILPSTTEQWGLVVNEAMASGLPVLVSNRCGCAAELVKEGSNGYTFNPLEIGEIADLMLNIGAAGVDRSAMGQKSREIIANWSPDLFGRNLTNAANYARSLPKRKMSNSDAWVLHFLKLLSSF